MKLRFTPRAIENLSNITDYLRSHSPAAAPRVRAAIYASLQNLILPERWPTPTVRESSEARDSQVCLSYILQVRCSRRGDHHPQREASGTEPRTFRRLTSMRQTRNGILIGILTG